MPYIKQKRRDNLDNWLDGLANRLTDLPWTAGDLNYCLFYLFKRLWDNRRGYQTANDFHGALDCCGKEFYRRVVVPYEAEKLQANGDVL